MPWHTAWQRPMQGQNPTALRACHDVPQKPMGMAVNAGRVWRPQVPHPWYASVLGAPGVHVFAGDGEDQPVNMLVPNPEAPDDPLWVRDAGMLGRQGCGQGASSRGERLQRPGNSQAWPSWGLCQWLRTYLQLRAWPPHHGSTRIGCPLCHLHHPHHPHHPHSVTAAPSSSSPMR